MAPFVSVRKRILDYFRDLNPALFDGPVPVEQLKLRRALDSLQTLNFIVFLETALDVRLDDNEMMSDEVETIGGVIALVERKRTRTP